MSGPDLQVGQLARVRDPDARAPVPWHYGKVVGFTEDPSGRQHPILELLSVPKPGCPHVTSYYFTRIDRERVERAFHTFSDN